MNVQPRLIEPVALAGGFSLPVEGHGVALIHFYEKGTKLKSRRLVSGLSS